MSQTTNTITIMVPTTPKPSMHFSYEDKVGILIYRHLANCRLIAIQLSTPQAGLREGLKPSSFNQRSSSPENTLGLRVQDADWTCHGFQIYCDSRKRAERRWSKVDELAASAIKRLAAEVRMKSMESQREGRTKCEELTYIS